MSLNRARRDFESPSLTRSNNHAIPREEVEKTAKTTTNPQTARPGRNYYLNFFFLNIFVFHSCLPVGLSLFMFFHFLFVNESWCLLAGFRNLDVMERSGSGRL